MNRISMDILRLQVATINRLTGSPQEPYSKDEDGKFKANPRNYHLSQAYGGVALERMSNEGGGVRRISNTGYGTKRELYNFMYALIAGLENS